jgi:hypothetical protein
MYVLQESPSLVWAYRFHIASAATLFINKTARTPACHVQTASMTPGAKATPARDHLERQQLSPTLQEGRE